MGAQRQGLILQNSCSLAFTHLLHVPGILLSYEGPKSRVSFILEHSLHLTSFQLKLSVTT